MDLPFLGKNKKHRVEKIKIDRIVPNPHQPRSDFDKDNLKKLAESIDNFGIIQPLIVKEDNGVYQLIAGERRLRAAKMIDLKEVPAIVNNYKEEEVAEISLVENIQRQDLNFLDEALAYYSIMNKFDLSQTELAKKVGKSQSTVANKLRILRLPEPILALIRKYNLSERHARALLKIEDNEKQKELIKEINNKNLSVRSLNRRINQYLKKDVEPNKVKTLYKDTRLLKNTLNSAIEQIRKAGIEVNVKKEDKEDFIRYDITIPKKKDENE
jgi:ParB family chromosome partitioning protein